MNGGRDEVASGARSPGSGFADGFTESSDLRRIGGRTLDADPPSIAGSAVRGVACGDTTHGVGCADMLQHLLWCCSRR